MHAQSTAAIRRCKMRTQTNTHKRIFKRMILESTRKFFHTSDTSTTPYLLKKQPNRALPSAPHKVSPTLKTHSTMHVFIISKANRFKLA